LTQQNKLTFTASLFKLDAANKTAWFYLMNTSRNRNNWKITAQALDEALPTLINKPIGMGKDYKTGHYKSEESINTGVWVEFENKGNYALGKMRSTDDKAWDMLVAGEIGPISTVILPFRDVCSVCGADLTVLGAEWGEHPCIKKADACSVVESFVFERFDYVDVPAYPQAGFLEFASKSDDKAVPLTLLACFYEKQATCNAGIKPNSSEVKNLSEKDTITIKKADYDKMQTDLEAANKNADKVKQLEAQLNEIKTAEHNKLVADVIEARKEAGLDTDKSAFEKLSAETLELMKADAKKIAESQQKGTGPKAKYNKEANADPEDIMSALNKKRAEIGLKPIKETD
jgi:hypothetical protein